VSRVDEIILGAKVNQGVNDFATDISGLGHLDFDFSSNRGEVVVFEGVVEVVVVGVVGVFGVAKKAALLLLKYFFSSFFTLLSFP